jgi:hypothetical protein
MNNILETSRMATKSRSHAEYFAYQRLKGSILSEEFIRLSNEYAALLEETYKKTRDNIDERYRNIIQPLLY